MLISPFKLTLLFTFSAALLFSSQLLVNQAKQFLLENNGPPLTNLQIWGVTIIFVSIGSSMIATTLFAEAPWLGSAKTIGLLAWGIPMVLLDMRNYWLPLRFTTGFWLTGLLFTLLPASTLTVSDALIGSCGMFAVLYTFHNIAKRLRGEEGFGLGDVHLIAALCAWFPWQLASLLSGCAFLLFSITALLIRKTTQPYAPWLFGLLAGLSGWFSHSTISGVL